jgi:hypothetical protein
VWTAQYKSGVATITVESLVIQYCESRISYLLVPGKASPLIFLLPF